MKLTEPFVELDAADGVFMALEHSGTVAKLCYPCAARMVRASGVHDLIDYLKLKTKLYRVIIVQRKKSQRVSRQGKSVIGFRFGDACFVHH